MLDITKFKRFLKHDEVTQRIDEIWDLVGQSFVEEQANLPPELAMPRKELSFHDQVKFLGYLCWLIADVPGDIIEIGVWKGKSISFMNQMCLKQRRIIGVDPMALPNQPSELGFYHERLFPDVTLIRGFSELSIGTVLNLKPETLILHIDGGHLGRNVLLDFLLYAPTVISGGFVVFDDYADHKYSPEVGPAIDLLRVGGYFKDFFVMGPVPGYENSYLLQKK